MSDEAKNRFVNVPRAKNPDSIPMPSAQDLREMYVQQTNENFEVFSKEISEQFAGALVGVDLEAHGVDSKTLTYLPGYGPNGKLPVPKVSLWRKIIAFIKALIF